MKETVLHAELAAAFRAAGCWVQKWPDQAVSRMIAARDGGLRFTLPKPCDLVGCWPNGRLLAVEAKLSRARTFRVDARMIRQVATLRDLDAHGAWTAVALNFRYASRRPVIARVNRCVLVILAASLEALTVAGVGWTADAVAALGVELPRVTGGWRLDGETFGLAQARAIGAAFAAGRLGSAESAR
jgi:hypothetical protein